MPIDPAAFQATLLPWYATERRRLPWREAPSLYRTVVSEFMLQQTQVKTMLPYFDRWMRRFPDFESLAQAPPETVLKHWEGLGYYSRARNLHKLARAWQDAVTKPQTAEAWRAYPGVGPYTAAAIASICFGEPVAVVDGNVVRILARLLGDKRQFKNGSEAVQAFRQAAQTFLNRDAPGDHNQAMMELGATVCLKQKPLCTVCPVVRFCAAARSGRAESLPNIGRRPTEAREVDRLVLVDAGRLLLHRNPESNGRLAGQHEFPDIAELAFRPTGPPAVVRTRAITHYRIRERLHIAEPTRELLEAASRHPHLIWLRPEELKDAVLTGPHRKWLEALMDAGRLSFEIFGAENVSHNPQ